MILVNGDHDEGRAGTDALASMTYDFDLEHSVYVEYSARSKRYFDYWHKAHPFYQNVSREGIVLYESTFIQEWFLIVWSIFRQILHTM